MTSVHLVRGDDAVLVAQALDELLVQLVGAEDRALVVEEVAGDDPDLGAIVAAAHTPPFLTDRRVVVGRGIEALAADQLGPLLAYLDDPMPTTDLVLVAVGGRLPKALTDALKRVGATTKDASVSTRESSAWVDDHVRASGLQLDGEARAELADRLGEDLGRLQSVIETLRSAYGDGAKLAADDVLPFLGEAGGIPPWELTDPIDRGDTSAALVALRRLLRGGDRHPLQLMAILQGHYVRMLRLDGAGASSRDAAAALLGVKSPFQAGKALDQLRRLGGDGVQRAIELLATADLDLRGARELPDEVVMEVLVARLSRLAPARRR